MTKIVTAMAMGIGVLLFFLSVFVIGRPLSGGFIFSVGMVVAFVPEGLLPTVTLSLAMGVQRMAKRNALIKKLSSVETLGSCTVICTDKTGTLTQNEMTVREAWVAGAAADGERASATSRRASSVPRSRVATRRVTATTCANCSCAAALCNNAKLVPPHEEEGWTILGDPTEAALLVAAAKGGVDRRPSAPRSTRGCASCRSTRCASA